MKDINSVPCSGQLWDSAATKGQIPSPGSIPDLLPHTRDPCSVHASAAEVNANLSTVPTAATCYRQRKKDKFQLSGKPPRLFPRLRSSQLPTPEGASLHPCAAGIPGTSFLFLKPFIPVAPGTSYVWARSCALPGSHCCPFVARSQLQEKENASRLLPCGQSHGKTRGQHRDAAPLPAQASSAAAHLRSCMTQPQPPPES